MILDTTVLFDLMADDTAAFDEGVELVDRGELRWLPTPVVPEVYYGAVTLRSDSTASEVRNRLLGYPRVSIDEEIAKTARELLARADDGAGGNGGIGWNDAQVAATADALDDAVLTENVADFEALCVDVETY